MSLEALVVLSLLPAFLFSQDNDSGLLYLKPESVHIVLRGDLSRAQFIKIDPSEASTFTCLLTFVYSSV